jgi:hypothetical protein
LIGHFDAMLSYDHLADIVNLAEKATSPAEKVQESIEQRGQNPTRMPEFDY